MNDAASLHGIKYHDPNEIFPIAIFYGKDSGDNLEENLGFPNSWLDTFISENQMADHTFYLSGDEMFLEAMLDGSNVLGPTTKQGWDIYSEQPDKEKTLNNFRTDASTDMNRIHSDRILQSIPLPQTVLCLLHAVARSLEKLLTLEVELILKRSNKETQAGRDASSYVKEKIFLSRE